MQARSIERQEALNEQNRQERQQDQAMFRELLVPLVKATSQPANDITRPTMSSTPINPATKSTLDPYIKLTKITPPSFSGEDLTLWPTYWAQFDSAVHSNPNLGSIAKMHHLLHGLTGKARRVVSGMPITDQNYDEALKLLQARFGSDQNVEHRLVAAINGLPTVKPDDSNLESFVDSVMTTLQSWKTICKSPDVFYSIIYSKLHRAMLKTFDESTKNPNLSALDQLTEFLQSQANQLLRHSSAISQSSFKLQQGRNNMPSLTSTSQSKGVPTQRRPVYSKHPKPQNPTYQQQSFVHSSNQNTTNPPWQSFQQKPFKNRLKDITCAFCGQTGIHYSGSCPQTTDPKTRAVILKQKNRCLRCLHPLAPDHAQFCKKKCCFFCGGPHHGSICQNQASLTQMTETPAMANGFDSNQTQIYMMITTGWIGPSENREGHKAVILFDSGSRTSFIQASTAQAIGCHYLTKSFPLAVAAFGSDQTEYRNSRQTKFSLRTLNRTSIPIIANTVESITTPLSSGPMELPSHIITQLNGQRLTNHFLDTAGTFTIDIIIGADYFNELVFESQRLSPQLILRQTALGPLLFGRTGDSNDLCRQPSMATTALLSQAEPTQDILGRMWELEHLGIQDSALTSDDDVAMAQFEDTIQKIDGRYYVHWPWRQSMQMLPDNYTLAKERVKRFHKSQLLPKPDLLMKYDDLIKDQESKGIIEKVPFNEIIDPHYTTHYIPHHGVFKETSNTTKLRVVYDASAKTVHGTALNQHLLRGPVILADLVGLLLRFRLWNFVTISDVEKAFLQVGLDPSQRDVCRFIWLKDPTQPHTKENQQIYRFCHVPFGMISSPFLLGATIQHHLKLEGSELALDLRDNIYVDNIVYGKETEQELLAYYQEAKPLFDRASMNLCEWTTNSMLLQSHLKESDKGPTSNVKVLGIRWDPLADTIVISGSPSKPPEQQTKRTLLHSMASIFDPLGLLSPVMLPLKLLFQILWTRNLSWDDPIPDDLQTSWTNAFQNLTDIAAFVQRRELLTMPISQPELICFTDASSKAYGAVVYLKNGPETVMLCSKARVTPLKAVTIPRLELLAVLIGVRLLVFLQCQLRYDFKSIHLFSDSQIVLSWIGSPMQRTVFVENRLTEIHKQTNITYHYICTDENPADLTTKGCSVKELVTSSKWAGPMWLKDDSSTWETWKVAVIPPEEEEEIWKVQKKPPNCTVPCLLLSRKIHANTQSSLILPTSALFADFSHRLPLSIEPSTTLDIQLSVADLPLVSLNLMNDKLHA